MDLKNTLARILHEVDEDQPAQTGSYAITNKALIRSFIRNPENTFLVSFPRTGSHWLRMLMEAYFERPSLTRVFYFSDRKDYLSLHTHDLDLKIVRPIVIYLYRDPVDTVFSQLTYHQEDINDLAAIKSWTELYAQHLNKWLHTETFTRKKTVIRFERLKGNLADEFPKVCEHFGVAFDPVRLSDVSQQVTKEHVKQKTGHDPQVINLTNEYEGRRQEFRDQFDSKVWEIILKDRAFLAGDF